MGRTYETAIKIGATISKAFKGDTYNAAAALTKLTAAVTKLKAAEKSAASLQKLDGALAKAKGRYDGASAALQRLTDAEKAAGGATKDSTKWRKAGERAVASAAREFDRATKAAVKHKEVLHALGIDTAKLASEQVRLAKSLAATERQEKSLERYEHARERLFGKKKEHEPLAAKAKEQVKGIGETVLHFAEGALVAGEAMHLLVEKTMEAGANIGETAEKLHIGTTALQELRYGAKQSGAEVEDLDRGLAKMAINIGKHALAKGKAGMVGIPGFQAANLPTGSGAEGVIDPFKKIGLNAKDLAKLAPEEQLKKIADGMAKLKTHAEQAAVGSLIFGKGITELLPFFAEGAEGIEKLSAKANKYGGVLSKESIDAAMEADNAAKDMNLALAGLANTLGAVLLPTAVKVFKGISSWVGENQGAIKKWGEGAAHWIEDKGIPAFKNIAREVQSFASRVLHLVEVGAKLTGGFGNLALIMAGLRIAPLALTFTKIGIEGTKAAIAVAKYVAAKKAAAALGSGIDGMGPGAASAWAKAGGAIGVAASAAMVLGAAAVGGAIGLYLDNKFKISDSFEQAHHILTTKDADLNETDRATKHSTWSIVKGFVTGGGQGAIEASKKAQADFVAQKAAQLVTSNRGSGVHVAPVLQFYGPATRDDVDKGMDAAKKAALEAYDKREAHQKRVSFGH